MCERAVGQIGRASGGSRAFHGGAREGLLLPHAISWWAGDLYPAPPYVDLDPVDSDQAKYMIDSFPLSVSQPKP